MRLIDADAVISKVEEVLNKGVYKTMIIELIRNAPTIGSNFESQSYEYLHYGRGTAISNNKLISKFLDECCIPRQGKGYDKCSRPVLWRVFLAWCRDNTKSDFQGTKHDFFDAIEDKGWGNIVTINGAKYYRNFTVTRFCKLKYEKAFL